MDEQIETTNIKTEALLLAAAFVAGGVANVVFNRFRTRRQLRKLLVVK